MQTTLHTQTGVLSAVQQTLNGGLRSMTQLLSFQRLANAAVEGRPEEANSVLVRPYRLPFRWCGRRFAVRRRSGLTVLANGRYKVEIGGQEQTAEVKGAFVRFEREILVKKPMEIVILSKEKE